MLYIEKKYVLNVRLCVYRKNYIQVRINFYILIASSKLQTSYIQYSNADLAKKLIQKENADT